MSAFIFDQTVRDDDQTDHNIIYVLANVFPCPPLRPLSRHLSENAQLFEIKLIPQIS